MPGNWPARPGAIRSYFASDRHRYAMVHEGQGHLIFTDSSLGDVSYVNLIWSVPNVNEAV